MRTGLDRILALHFLTLFVISSCRNAESQEVPRIRLVIRDEARITVPPFSSRGNLCGPAGEPYFELSDIYSVKVILHMRTDGTDPDAIPFPAGYDPKGLWNFSVGPAGNLYMLLSGTSDPLLLEVSSSGEELNRLHVKLPLSLHVDSFAVETGGRSVVFGSIEKSYEETGVGSSAPPTLIKGIPYLFWVDNMGGVLKQRVGEDFLGGVVMPDGLVAATKARTFYFATSKEIREYSYVGRLLQTFPVKPPAPHAHTQVLQIEDGVIAIQYLYPVEAVKENELYLGALAETWLLINPITGIPVGYFDRPDGFMGSALCFEGQRSFLYITGRDKQTFLTTAQP